MKRRKTEAQKKRRPERIRRTPKAARALILEAASGVLADLGPDRAGLKEVAAAAGVSHALVTHYFGTFSALVEEVLEVPLTHLQDARNLHEEIWTIRGIPVRVPFYLFKGNKIWGATAMVLAEFLELLE